MRGTWDDVNRRLTGALLALDQDDSLIVGDRQEKPRRGLLGRRSAARAPRRYVQVTSGRDRLLAECVGSTSFGGEWEMSPETEEALVRMGWEKPWSPEYPTFQREGALVQAPRLALACVRALQLLGCEVADLDVELVHEDPST